MSGFGLAIVVIFVLVFLAHWSDYDDRERRGQPHPWQRPQSPSNNPSNSNPPPPVTFSPQSPDHLYDAGGRLIATIHCHADRQEIFAANGVYKGRYDFHTNQTLNSHGMVVCYGNALSSLV